MKPIIKCNDNLAELKKIPNGSVDLVYIDPPFKTQKHRGDYDDRWTSREAYLTFMRPRLEEIHRVLTPTGALYVHSDWHADAYLRVMVDEIFGHDPVNVITWKRTPRVKGTSGKFGRNADTIIVHAKTGRHVMNVPVIPLNATQVNRDYKHVEPETGRRFNHSGLLLRGRPNTLVIDGKTFTAPAGRRFRWSQSFLDAKTRENPHVLYWPRSSPFPRTKNYLDDHGGIPVGSIWDDIVGMGPGGRQYETEKPEQLLERIIKASSNPGDVVLDAFAGSGTTCAVAKRLGRKSICIDRNPKACQIMEERLS